MQLRQKTIWSNWLLGEYDLPSRLCMRPYLGSPPFGTIRVDVMSRTHEMTIWDRKIYDKQWQHMSIEKKNPIGAGMRPTTQYAPKGTSCVL